VQFISSQKLPSDIDNACGFQLEAGGGMDDVCVCKAKLLQGCPETKEKV
jgi:hypothetical protein